MKFVIQKETGLGETCVAEYNGAHLDLQEVHAIFKAMDERLMDTNRKIIEAREFVAQVKDPNYRYLFTAFLDNFLGVSSQAEPLLRKFKVEAPPEYDKWLEKQTRTLEVKK